MVDFVSCLIYITYVNVKHIVWFVNDSNNTYVGMFYLYTRVIHRTYRVYNIVIQFIIILVLNNNYYNYKLYMAIKLSARWDVRLNNAQIIIILGTRESS